MKKQYHKLIRDRIVEIIEADGKKAKTRVLGDVEYEEQLYQKAKEELLELHDTPCKEEVADVLEVVYALAEYYQLSLEEIEQTRLKKLQSNGGFKKRLFLYEVSDE